MYWNLADDPEGNTPEGYTSWDLMFEVGTNLDRMELIVETDSAGDIYQHIAGNGYFEPNPYWIENGFPEVEFDTYVTAGAWDYPAPVTALTGAVTIEPGSSLTFDDQDLNIQWFVDGGQDSGPGTFQVARLTVRDGATGSWRFMGFEDGGDGQYFEGSLPIPEPATVGLLLMGGLAMIRRRRVRIARKHLTLLVCVLVLASSFCQAATIDPLSANGNMYVADSAIGGIIEIDRNTLTPVGFHLNIPTGDLQFSPSNALYVNNTDNRYNVHPDFSYHTYNTNEQPRTGSWHLRDDRTLITATMGGAEINGGLIRIYDANDDGQANGYSEAQRYISASGVQTFAFKGQDYSKIYFVQYTTGLMFQAPWQSSGTPTLFANNPLLQGQGAVEFLSYHPNGNFYALNNTNILQISGDGSSISQIFTPGQSPLSNPVQMIIAPDGNLYVADDGHDNLFRISPDGLEVSALLQEGLFTSLRGVAIAIPEPATVGLLLAGLLVVAARRRTT